MKSAFYSRAVRASEFIDEDDGEPSKSINRFLPLAFLIEKKDPQITFRQIFPDFDGSLHNLLHRMRIGSSEKNLWMKWWLQMTIKDDDHKVDLTAFRLSFRLDSSIWIERLFEIINFDLSGRASFAEFLDFCYRYILVDKISTLELCFRLLSRRGTNFIKEFSVLDTEDIETYLIERYTTSQKGKLKKMAQDVLKAIENCARLVDNGGAIMFEDFVKYCEVNPLFVRFTHRIQTHLRNTLFGLPYWIERSRKVKVTQAGGLSSLMTSKSNSASETFLSVDLYDADSERVLMGNADAKKAMRRLSFVEYPKRDNFQFERTGLDLAGGADGHETDNLQSKFGCRHLALIDVGMLVTTRLIVLN